MRRRRLAKAFGLFLDIVGLLGILAFFWWLIATHPFAVALFFNR